MGRRRFGKVRQLASGRFQASFLGPGGRVTAPTTFRTKTDADRWLVDAEAKMNRGTWSDQKRGLTLFEDYASAYLRESADIGPRWEETCRRNMRLHMTTLLRKPLIEITAPTVRSWHATLWTARAAKPLSPSHIGSCGP